MFIEICLLTVVSVLSAAFAARQHAVRHPSTARHRRDRYSVAAIRARVERENQLRPACS